MTTEPIRTPTPKDMPRNWQDVRVTVTFGVDLSNEEQAAYVESEVRRAIHRSLEQVLRPDMPIRVDLQ